MIKDAEISSCTSFSFYLPPAAQCFPALFLLYTKTSRHFPQSKCHPLPLCTPLSFLWLRSCCTCLSLGVGSGTRLEKVDNVLRDAESENAIEGVSVDRVGDWGHFDGDAVHVLTEIAWDATVGFGRLRLESLIEVALGGAEG